MASYCNESKTCDVTITVPNPDFSITPSGQCYLYAAGTNNAKLTLQPENCFSGSVTIQSDPEAPIVLSFSDGVSDPLNPYIAVLNGSTDVTPLATAKNTVTSGHHLVPVTVYATANSSITHDSSVDVIVGGFTLTSNPDNVKIKAGATRSITITAEPQYGFVGTIALSTNTTGFSIDTPVPSITIDGSSAPACTITLRVAGDVPLGQHTVTIVGTSGYVSATCDIQVNVTTIDENITLTISSDHTSVCAGGIPSAPHQATISAVLKDGNDPIPNATVNFSIENSDPSYPASLSSATAVTDSTGTASVILTSSVEVDATAIVTASYNVDYSDETTITMEAATADVRIDPDTLIADGTSEATVTITMTYNGLPVDGHNIAWSIDEIDDGSGTVVYTADPLAGSASGYGSITPSSITDNNGIATATYTVGTNVGTVILAAIDGQQLTQSASMGQLISLTKYCSGGGSKPKKYRTKAYPSKIDVMAIGVASSETIKNVGSIMYRAHYDSNGVIVIDIHHKPMANKMNADIPSLVDFGCFPADRSLDNITWKYTTTVMSGSIQKNSHSFEGQGSSGYSIISIPNCVGHYSVLHFVTIKQNGNWKGSLSGEKSDLYSIYNTHLCNDNYFTEAHLKYCCDDLAGGTNDLSENGQYSIPRSVQVNMYAGGSNYHTGTGAEDLDWIWEGLIMQNPNFTNKFVEGLKADEDFSDWSPTQGDCIAWATAHSQVLSLLGISSQPILIQGERTIDGVREIHLFYMAPNHSGPWNFHAVNKVQNNYCYSITQTTQPVGTEEEMMAAPNGPVIQEWANWSLPF